jgi:hydrophobic/amphiphilic exporter-1 (mainly G- bacteria), HAE1 family
MPTFSLRHPYFIIVLCLFICVLGITSIIQMPVDMFPPINIPVVLVATFYNGMPPEQIEADITDTFERFFTLGSGIDHMESRSMSSGIGSVHRRSKCKCSPCAWMPRPGDQWIGARR